MDEYIRLLILAYFKEFKEEYNLVELKEKIGISFNMLDNYISELIESDKLYYKHNMLSISQKGRIQLMNSELENYSFCNDLEKEFLNEKWNIEKIYCVHEFSKKKWRGIEK